jgi:hypothetical protein
VKRKEEVKTNFPTNESKKELEIMNLAFAIKLEFFSKSLVLLLK